MAKMKFAPQSQKTSYAPVSKRHKVLVVDDDQAIHDITAMALNAMHFSDFGVQILTAFSAEEAKTLLQTHDDIALALVDVVMETPDAGLQLVNFIRNDLENKLIRLIVRTGQANDFPQMQVIQNYDINDFKEKTELTLERLYTTIRTSIKQYEQLLELEQKFDQTYRQMMTSALTRLPNRTKLIEDFSNHSAQSLVLIDIIGFSIINETNGFDVGDFVLKELGGFLSSMYTPDFNVYHLNSDLFALATTADKVPDLVTAVERIKDDISQLHLITDNFNKTIETTIGVAFQTEEDVIKKAELALKEARNSGRNQIKFYSNDLKVIRQINETNHWAPIIKHAIENGGLMACAQPIYNLEDNTIDKYELLVRLKHEGKVYTPMHFLDAADYSGQLYNIFKFMFEEGCRMAAKTGNAYSVNISNYEFHNEGIVDFIDSKMKEYGVDPSLISLEILEYNTIGNDAPILDKIDRIHQLGIELIIDDFGVQCSNFGHTEHFPVSTLKIDGSFIQNVHESRDSEIVVKTIRTFAREKGLKLVAEFVCNEAVYNKVKELGIKYAQGFYLDKPSPLNNPE